MQRLRETSDPRVLDEWTLVLAAIAIPHELVEEAGVFAILVEESRAARAEDALAANDKELAQRAIAAATTTPMEYGRSWIGVAIALALIGFFGVTGPWSGGARWFPAGAADAERLLHGQWWRSITALTLHADGAHVFGNAVACVVLVSALARIIGPGVGAWLLLLAGASANALTAWIHGVHHSVGASTATFAAIGALAGLALARRAIASSRRRWWHYVAAALALLGLLGTAKGSDVLAHALGVVTGGALGALVGMLLPRPPGRAVQWTLTLAAALAVVAAWWRALA